jgi:hypothetical protein
MRKKNSLKGAITSRDTVVEPAGKTTGSKKRKPLLAAGDLDSKELRKRAGKMLDEAAMRISGGKRTNLRHEFKKIMVSSLYGKFGSPTAKTETPKASPELPNVQNVVVPPDKAVSVSISNAHYYERVLTLRAGNILDLIEAKHRAYESCARYLDVVRVTSMSLIAFCRPPHIANPMTGECFGGAESMWELATYFTREAHAANQVIADELPAFVKCWREAHRFLDPKDAIALWGTMAFAVEHTLRHQAIYWTEFKGRLRTHGIDLDARTIKELKS